ncbi:protein LIGHT-DEPENDENT SHORT HYPOCOTYLS 4-like [Impatiens glandulifera]|uniref:protein LIGHT-DEPENDENT SHORT HYPOCOTYLS 4-like n=1 Tax=Impatiens glandulifera TaxID=253017 RepID=UPI001FB11E85|nr:protein LIGHT-DEPENDENT SHORT HYPOCOTYLS 4-like [Impatiens glandulifera]
MSAAVAAAAAAAAAAASRRSKENTTHFRQFAAASYNRPSSRFEGNSSHPSTVGNNDLYDSKKRSDWNCFIQYLEKHQPEVGLNRCGGPEIVEFLRSGEFKVHLDNCQFRGQCLCPVWDSLNAMVDRLRRSFTEKIGFMESNPFSDEAVEIYLMEIKDREEKNRGVTYDKKEHYNQLVNIAPPPPSLPSSPPPPRQVTSSSTCPPQIKRSSWWNCCCFSA